MALLQEDLEVALPRIPWPLPPPRPREHLEAGAEEWRSATLRYIDTRPNMYGPAAPEREHPPPNLSADRTARVCFHHALDVNELL